MKIYIQQVGSYVAGQGGVVGVAVGTNGYLYGVHLSTDSSYLMQDLRQKYAERYPDNDGIEWAPTTWAQKISYHFDKWRKQNNERDYEIRYADKYPGPARLW